MEKANLISDIKPFPVKDRSNLGVVELVLDVDTKIKVVGVVYGLEHEISGPGYTASLFLDHYNQRIRLIRYDAENLEILIEKLRWLAEANGFDKVICMVPRNDWQSFLKEGFVLEAVIKYYLKGDDAFVMSLFGSQERLNSPSLFEEVQLIRQILDQPISKKASPLPEGVSLRLAKKADVPQLIELYQSIFDSYPSPLIHEDYLNTVFQKESLFAVAVKDGKILSAASAELFPSFLSAELTDCATIPAARGNGLMSHILSLLEDELTKRGYICAYTMARSKSYGMNNCFYQMNYEFLGRLVNNCDIYGAYEDMNIWVRKLDAPK